MDNDRRILGELDFSPEDSAVQTLAATIEANAVLDGRDPCPTPPVILE